MDIQHEACQAIDVLLTENVPVSISNEMADYCHFDLFDMTELDVDEVILLIEQDDLIDFVIFGEHSNGQNT